MSEIKVRRGYRSDVTDEEWEFVLPYLLVCREDSGSMIFARCSTPCIMGRRRDVGGAGFRAIFLPGPLSTSRCAAGMAAVCFEALVADVQTVLRECCCQDDGWSNDPSPGLHASADSPETMNDSKPPSMDFTTSPSLSSWQQD